MWVWPHVLVGVALSHQIVHGWWEEEATPTVSVETGSRLALCRMDWDRVNATDIFGILPNSFYLAPNCRLSPYLTPNFRLSPYLAPNFRLSPYLAPNFRLSPSSFYLSLLL
jgi:hypothetical protein